MSATRPLLMITITVLAFAVPAAAQARFEHVSTSENTASNSTYLSHDVLDRNPNVIVVAEPTPAARSANPRAFGVWFGSDRWAVFNQDRSPMASGLRFVVRCALPGAGAFVARSEANAQTEGIVVLDHPRLNDAPDAVLHVCQCWNPGGLGGVYNDSDIRVEYDRGRSRWVIRNVSGSAIPENAAFNVIVGVRPSPEPTPADATPAGVQFEHRTTAESVSGNYSHLEHPRLDGNPRAIVIVEPTPATRTANPHPVGVWYSGSSRWAVFNEDRAGMPVGLTFAVRFADPGPSAFTVPATENNTADGCMVLDHPELNDAPAAAFSIGQSWNPDGGPNGVYNPHEIVVEYDRTRRRWIVRNRDGAAIPHGASFNVLIGTRPIGPRDLPTYPRVGNDVDFDNWGFERQLEGWTVLVGDAFRGQPLANETVKAARACRGMEYANGGLGGDYWKGLTYPIGIKGWRWIGTCDHATGETATGQLRSPTFVITRRFVHFLMGGSADRERVRVTLLVEEPNRSWVQRREVSNDRDGERLKRQWWDVSDLSGRSAAIVIDDSSTAGHLNVDDFRFTNDDPTTLFIANNTIRPYEWFDREAPVWGVADTHTHPTHHLGFGGRLIAGEPDGPLLDALSTTCCRSRHQVPVHGLGSDEGSPRAWNAFIEQCDSHRALGAPDFLGFPRFNVKTHQQQHVEWLRRAYEGGLRLVGALAVNNMFIATRALGPSSDGNPIDDESVTFRQLDALKAIVQRHSTWMEIALSPTDARRIILSGKLAVVLGVEVDNFANFGGEDYCWNDREGDQPLVTLTAANAAGLISRTLDRYHDYGVRQVTPIHYVSGVFGGAACMQAALTLPHLAFRDHLTLREGFPEGVYMNLLDDFMAVPTGLGAGQNAALWKARLAGADGKIGHVNAEGLTPIGRILLRGMMSRGWIVDCEHMSYLSKNDLFELSSALSSYPIMSSHTDPIALSIRPRTAGVRYAADPTNFDTRLRSNLGHEGQMKDADIARILASGGTVGVIMLPYRKEKYSGPLGDVPNDCDGSSKTWAQSYLHCVDRMQGRGVGLATDRGMVEFIAPRFGVNAGWKMKDERLADKHERRTRQRFAQQNGVRYDRASGSFHPTLFDGGDIALWEEDLWRALCAWAAGANPFADEAPIGTGAEPLHGGRPVAFARGLCAADESQLRDAGGDTPWEEAAMFALKRHLDLETWRGTTTRAHIRDNIDQVRRVYVQVAPVWQLWQRMSGNNEPLRRLRNGTRDWDYNLDGMAHCGMLPDFFQDLKNIGVGSRQLDTLFQSAEHYIQMWERAERLKAVAAGR